MAVEWNRGEFDKLKATWSPERIAEDAAALAEVFDMASKVSPLFEQELAWARQQGIEFFVDRSEGGKGMGAYYNVGTGALGVMQTTLADPANAARLIAHEIRHAWQDVHGLINRSAYPDFSHHFIATALIEADAEAFGMVTATQYAVNAAVGKVSACDYDEKKVARSVADYFETWFGEQGHSGFYGMRELIASIASPEEVRKELSTEFSTAEGAPLKENGISLENIQDVRHLGQGFSGATNYLSLLPRDFLVKRVLRTDLADTFWGAATPEQKKLTAELRKADIRRKLAQPKVKHPWP